MPGTYLDDGALAGPGSTVLRALEVLGTEGKPNCGIKRGCDQQVKSCWLAQGPIWNSGLSAQHLLDAASIPLPTPIASSLRSFFFIFFYF